MKPSPQSVDIAVLGGGPAGAAVAIRSAQLGHSVCVIERGCGHRHSQFSQSLAPSILPLLDLLEVREPVEAAGFGRAAGVLALWAEVSPRYRDFEKGNGMHIERSTFDEILRAAATRSGAVVLSPASVIAVERRPASSDWSVRVARGPEREDIHARILVDATGRRPAVPIARTRCSQPLIAILGNWRARDTVEHSIIEAGEDRWYWAGPTRDGTITAAVFLDPRSRLIGKGATLIATYRSLIAQSELLRDVTSVLLPAVMACDSTSRFIGDPLESDVIRVGEAAATFDPLSSQGIQTALTAGLQATVVANTRLRRPNRAMAAEAFYKERHAEIIAASKKNREEIYGRVATRMKNSFWLDRSSAQPASQPAPSRPSVGPLPDPLAKLRLANDVSVTRMAVAHDDLADFAPAIARAGPWRPVAFRAGVPVGSLAARLVPGTSAQEVVRAWSGEVGESAALGTLAWMWNCGVITADRAIND
jgi:flavin-dependent dehydrogenase